MLKTLKIILTDLESNLAITNGILCKYKKRKIVVTKIIFGF